jgi:hypothetical protein
MRWIETYSEETGQQNLSAARVKGKGRMYTVSGGVMRHRPKLPVNLPMSIHR